jgi:hypothetical protein
MKKLPYIVSLLLALVVLMQSAAVQAQSKISPQAKGAVIGGIGGAAAGVLINKKNRTVGGIVGGAVGAGTGYAVGKSIQNKQKARAAEAARVAAASRAARAERQAAAARAERNALAKRAEAAEQRAALAQAGQLPQQQALQPQAQYPAMATGFAAAGTPAMMYNTNSMGAAYLPNNSYGDRSTPYASSEVRRKSW